MAFLAIPLIEIAGEALIAAGEALLANAGRAAVVTGVAYGAAHMSNSSSSTSTGTNTTTVVGSGQLKCGDSGKYGDLLKKTAGGTLNRDHVPSKAALQQAARDLIKKARIALTEAQEKALFGDTGLISKAGQTIAIPTKDHQRFSETYGGRNDAETVNEDSKDLQKATERDTKAIEDAEGKEMDDECLKKYKDAAEKLRKKTHAEYIEELKALIKEAIKNVK